MGAHKFQYFLLTLTAEVSYLYPLYYLLSIGFKTPPSTIISFWVWLVITISAVIGNSFLNSRNMRILTKILINLILAGGIVFWAAILVDISELFSLEKGYWVLFQKWNLVLLILWIFFRSLLIFRKPPSYALAVSRFEIGIAFIFGIFLMASFLNISIPQAIICLMVFFLSSAGNLSLTKWQDIIGTSRSGLGFVAILLIPITMILSLILPFMNTLAGDIYRFTTPILIFARDLLARIIIFLFRRGNVIQDKGTSTIPVAESQGAVAIQVNNMPVLVEYFLKIAGWFVIIFGLITVVLFLLYLLRKILMRLLKVEKISQEASLNENWVFWIKGILVNLKKYLERISMFIFVLFPQKLCIYQSYKALLLWGALKKYPREKQETPFEYSRRLASIFPHQRTNLTVITDCYVAYIYGNQEPAPERIKQVESSIRKLYFRKIV